MFKARISNFKQTSLHGLSTWKDKLKKFVESYCELANKKAEQVT